MPSGISFTIAPNCLTSRDAHAATAVAPSARLQSSIRDYGAIGDGHTLNTQAIQAAIDATAQKGGGVVVVLPAVELGKGDRLDLRVAKFHPVRRGRPARRDQPQRQANADLRARG